MRPIREMGLLSLDHCDDERHGDRAARRVHRRGVAAAHEAQRQGPRRALRVEVDAARDGRRVAWQLLDYFDETSGISAMMRTTGYSLLRDYRD